MSTGTPSSVSDFPSFCIYTGSVRVSMFNNYIKCSHDIIISCVHMSYQYFVLSHTFSRSPNYNFHSADIARSSRNDVAYVLQTDVWP